MLTIKEHEDHVSLAPGYYNYYDAVERGAVAKAQHASFFDSDAHVDRVVAVGKILKDFFGKFPDYHTPRGINRSRPFENIKMCDVGRFLNRKTKAEKEAGLYEPLRALGNIEVISKNGHLLVRVF